METILNKEVVINENEVIKKFANHSSRLGTRVTLYKELDRLNQRASTGVYSDAEYYEYKRKIINNSFMQYFQMNYSMIEQEYYKWINAWREIDTEVDTNVKFKNPNTKVDNDLIDLCKGILNDNYVIGGTNINELGPIDSLIFIKEEVPKLVDHWIYLDNFKLSQLIITYIVKHGNEIKNKPVITYTGGNSFHRLYKVTDGNTGIEVYLFLEGIESEGNLLLMNEEDFNIFKKLV